MALILQKLVTIREKLKLLKYECDFDHSKIDHQAFAQLSKELNDYKMYAEKFSPKIQEQIIPKVVPEKPQVLKEKVQIEQPPIRVK